MRGTRNELFIILGAFVILMGGFLGAFAWAVHSDKEDCVAAGGTWTHLDCYAPGKSPFLEVK